MNMNKRITWIVGERTMVGMNMTNIAYRTKMRKYTPRTCHTVNLSKAGQPPNVIPFGTLEYSRGDS